MSIKLPPRGLREKRNCRGVLQVLKYDIRRDSQTGATDGTLRLLPSNFHHIFRFRFLIDEVFLFLFLFFNGPGAEGSAKSVRTRRLVGKADISLASNIF